MHADLTRSSFDPALGYRSVVMQQGRVLLDAEWNEQAAIVAHHLERRTADVVGRAGYVDADPGAFAVIDVATGLAPAGCAWEQLGVIPGRYYVGGMLVEAGADPGDPRGAWTLADQPHLPGLGGAAGLAEPEGADGRWAVRLDAFEHLVTADERPALLESALGGPDTAAREQTVWQASLVALGAETCADLSDLPPRTPRTMAASLEEAEAAANPCEITTGGGYTLLENQLYRVEIHDLDPVPRFVWSRENGSVVAGLVALAPTVQPAVTALTVDRSWRDEELSIEIGDVVEVTSVDLRLRGEPGHLATVVDQVDRVLHVTWDAAAPASVAALGRTPIVRRWEGPARPLDTAPQVLEGGIRVAFPGGGTPAVGDYWLIPARTVRLAYGTIARQGTIEWPSDVLGPIPLAPRGPWRVSAPLAILERSGGLWSLDEDCRPPFLPLTSLSAVRTLRLQGGDGQSVAQAGQTIPQLVRVVVDSPLGPVEGAVVTAQARAGAFVAAVADGSAVPGSLPGGAALAGATTDAAGMAAFVWQPVFGAGHPGVPTSDLLTVFLAGAQAGPIVVTAQLDPPASLKTPGVHIIAVRLATGSDLENDSDVTAVQLSKGIELEVDPPVLVDSVNRKPVGRLLVEIPWPTRDELQHWTPQPAFGRRTVELRGAMESADGVIIAWRPQVDIIQTLEGMIGDIRRWIHDGEVPDDELPLLLRFQLDGWAIMDESQKLHLNGHADTVSRQGFTRLELPTTDEVTGGRFDTWFRVVEEAIRPLLILPDFVGATLGRLQRWLESNQLPVAVEEIDAPGVRRNTILQIDPAPGSEIDPGTVVTVRVSKGVG